MLAVLLAVALALRWAPLLRHAVWGADTGEYLAITRHIQAHGAPPSDYGGWGLAYPDFPGMEILVAQVSLAIGADALPVLQLLVPALNVLVVAATFWIGRRLFDRRSALFAAAIVAVAMPTVFTGSHPMPESLAHGLALVVACLALDADDPRRFAAAVGVGAAVVVTHHLTTYFLLLALVGLWAAKVLRHRTSAWPRLALVGVLGATTLAYWSLHAGPFMERIVAQALPLEVAVLAPLAVLGALAVVAHLRLRSAWTLEVGHVPQARSLRLGAGMVGGGLVAAGAFAVVGVPGTTLALDPAVVPWYVPLMLVFGLVPLGAARARGVEDGVWLYAWPMLIGASLIVGAVWLPTILIPYRHVPFLMVPVALMAGAGLAKLDLRGWRRVVPVILVVLLATTAYPPPSAIGGFDEGVSDAEMAAVRWADRNLAEGTPVLADHRLSSLLFGVAELSPSWDSGEGAWFAGNWTAARPHLEEMTIPSGTSRILYVVVSPATRQGVALDPWKPARPLDGGALTKFRQDPFVPVYDRDGVRIYRIDWAAAPGPGPAAGVTGSSP